MKHDKQNLWENIRVASPCKQSWDLMDGDEHVRFCKECKANVYKITALTQVQAEQLIQEKEGKLSNRLYRKADGTVMTRDRPASLMQPLLALGFVFVGAIIATMFVTSIVQTNPLQERALEKRQEMAKEPANEVSNNMQNEMPKKVKMVKVMFVNKTIERGQVLGANDLTEAWVDADKASAYFASRDNVIGRKAVHDIPSAWPVHRNAVSQ